jgi:hypothetical protein
MKVRNRGTRPWVISRVSSEAMLLRLRSARLWESELPVWRLMTGGGFSLHRMVGGRRVEWEGSESHLLRDAWNTGRAPRRVDSRTVESSFKF